MAYISGMSTAYSKITSKHQTVVPREIRHRLGLKPGDRLRYTVTPKGVHIEKANTPIEEDPFAVFSEWASDADEKAFGSL
jgi:antitoxin PrlF